MQYIAFPLTLKFNPNREKHIAAVIERLSKDISIVGQVQAVVANSWDDAINELIEATKKEYVEFLIKNNNSADFSDFQLGYQINEIKNNRVWGPAGTVQYKWLK